MCATRKEPGSASKTMAPTTLLSALQTKQMQIIPECTNNQTNNPPQIEAQYPSILA